MKEKILKYTIYVTGFFCLYVFISIRVLPLYNSLLAEKLVPGYWDLIKYGELYYFNYIKHFREENLPLATRKHQFSNLQPQVNDAEMFAFGDSFLDISRPFQFPTVLAQKINKKVHYGYYDYPLQYLKEKGYKKKEEKTLIMGIVERYIPVKFEKPHDTLLTIAKQENKLIESVKEVRDFIFYRPSEKMYDGLLKRSYLTSDIYSEIATLKFDWFGYISDYTPVYSLDDTIPWLFVKDEVDGNKTSFYYHHSQEEIDSICNNIADLARKLKSMYNLNLVFIPIPAKFTVYHSHICNEEYNNFIPRLEAGLEQREVPFVDLYNEFERNSQLLYYGTDAHWNDKGLKQAVDLTVEYLSESNLIDIQ